MDQHANRGQYLEDWVEQTNRVYERKKKALISKIPTSWKIVRGYSPYSKRYSITNAFPEKKSTVDFGGVASSQAIWFDAKATKNKKSFPLANIHDHQIEYLTKVENQGGKAFLLIHSKELKKTWLLWIDQLRSFRRNSERKSIPFDWLEANCEEVKKGDGVILDYLPLVLRRTTK